MDGRFVAKTTHYFKRFAAAVIAAAALVCAQPVHAADAYSYTPFNLFPAVGSWQNRRIRADAMA